MAIYRCSVKVIGRSAGRSAVAAAAYRSGGKLKNEWDGVEHDYTRKNWVVHSEIILPDNAPKEYKDREALWNAVELAEKSSNAELCREVELALPLELSLEEQIKLVQDYVKLNFVSEGMCADICIHNPPVTDDRHRLVDGKLVFQNPHAHILLTLRPISEAGKWEAKSEVEYLCVKNGEERALTAKELKLHENEGFEKQYKYLVDGKKKWMTQAEGKECGIERVDRHPRTTKFGRQNPTSEKWNSPETLLSWRRSWEEIVNQALEEKGIDERIDCRSYAAQGKEQIPTVHLGPEASNMLKRAKRLQSEGKSAVIPEKAELNNLIESHNLILKELQEVKEMLKTAIAKSIEALAKQLEYLRAQIICCEYDKTVLGKLGRRLESDISDMEYAPEIFGSSEIAAKQNILEKVDAEISKATDAEEKLLEEYKLFNKSKISNEEKELLVNTQKIVRHDIIAELKNKLISRYKSTFRESDFKAAQKLAEKIFVGKNEKQKTRS